MQAEAGAEWTRVSVDWAFLQPNESAEIPAETLAVYDAQVRAAVKAGMKVLVTIGNSPSWSRGNVSSDAFATPPDDLSAYRRFIGNLVAHFAPMDVRAYEIWNEPNLGVFWPAPDPAAYTALLRTAYPAIKAADPAARVIAGSLAPVNKDYPPAEFLKGMYAAGAKGFFDVLSAHVFPSGNPAVCARHGRVPVAVNDFCFVEHYRKVQRAHSDKRPIWLTEFGYGTEGLHAVTREEQARYLVRGFKVARRYRYVKTVLWFSFRDMYPADEDSWITWIHSSGLVAGDYTPKPAFGAYQRVANRLRKLRLENRR
jgi:hypothetical protein